MSKEKQYAERDLMGMDVSGNHYCRHISAMTREQLHSKSDIAAELGWRDMQIAELKAQRDCFEKSATYSAETNRKLTNKMSMMTDMIDELKAQRDALAAEVTAIREQAECVYAAGYNHGHLNTVDGIAYAPNVKDEFYHNALQVVLEVETPATDAYLNSVRAEGVEILTGKLQQLIDEGVFDAKEIGVAAGAVYEGAQIAAQLRAGEPS